MLSIILACGWSSPPGADEGSPLGISEKPDDFTLMDQHGDIRSLYEFEGQVVLINISAIWCYGCNLAAMDAEELYQEFEEQGFTYLIILGEDAAGNPPDQEDLMQWANTYGLTLPLLSDPEWEASQPWIGDAEPAFHVLDRDMTIQFQKVGYNPATDREVIRSEVMKYL